MFHIKTKVYFGQNSLNELSKLSYQKVLMITDKFMVKIGAAAQIKERMPNSTIEVFDDIVPDPPIEKVVLGIEKLTAFSPDAIIALGGGSAIDGAKAIKEFGLKVMDNKKIDFIAIPTTSGTGSEVTSFSVITDPSKNRKYPLVSDAFLPDYAILDPQLVVSASDFITADTGMDVLTHSIEAYVSREANDFSDSMAEKSITLTGKYLLKAYKNGEDILAREKMHNASCLAGMAFNAVSLGMNHAIAHNIGGRFHVPHGRCNSILLPYVIAYNAQVNGYTDHNISASAIRYAKIAKILNLSASNPAIAVKSLIRFIEKLQKEMHMPTKLSECGIDRTEYDAAKETIAKGALEDGCMPTNPIQPSLQDVMTILDQIY